MRERVTERQTERQENDYESPLQTTKRRERHKGREREREGGREGESAQERVRRHNSVFFVFFVWVRARARERAPANETVLASERASACVMCVCERESALV